MREDDSVTTGEIVVTAAERVDLTNCGEFRDALQTAAESAESLTVDLRVAQFMDSAVLQQLASAAIRMNSRGKRLTVIIRKGSYVQELLSVVCLDRLVDVVME